MSEDGNHICLDATPGCEKIGIYDQYGNHVVLNAADERLELFSKFNKSGLQLGNTKKGSNYGVYIYSDAEYYLSVKNKYTKHIEGNSVTTVLGTYTTAVAGAYTAAVGGLYTALAVAGKIDVCLGAKLESCVGWKIEANYCDKVNLTSSTDYRKATNITDTAKNVWAATAGTLALLYAKHQVLIASDGNVSLAGKVVSVNGNVFTVKP